ncbi:hypothetical protein HS041_36570 [Planomonospora sp. ID67723]|uniref:hypothetical protein n=1 Tax=Planomonospora sp. ID67723 TaxID=2738134 RepID=UPI0018C3A766|nr:hypothetical protein [Planomonospora sp. ID67723]MBG0833220.1 hypothetical protein [Planomonospora sp. ID67723]
MRIDEYKLSVQPGEGIIGRFPSAVFLLVSEDDAAEPDKLISLFDGPAGPVEDLGDRLEELLTADGSDAIAAFAALVETDQRMSLYLHGPVEVVADGPNVDFRAWGPGERPLLKYEVPGAAGSLSVRYTEGSATERTWASLDFRGGAVPGNGFVLKRLDMAPSDMAQQPDMMDTAMLAPTPLEEMTREQPRQMTREQPRPVLPTPSRTRQPYITPSPQISQTLPTALPTALPGPAASQETVTTGHPRPTYLSRLLSRLLVSATVGAAWTAAVAPLLPGGFAPLSEIYTMVTISLGLLVVLGIVLWDPIYTLAQRSRREKDWPAALFLLQAVPEGLLAYGVQALVLDAFVVSQPTLVVHLATTSILLGLGLFCLKFLGFARRRLLRSETTQPATMMPGNTAAAPRTGISPDPAQAPLVWGVNCQQGHFNRPDARYCGSCGTAMHGLTREPFQAPRPVLGYLVSDDGTAYALDADYVVGRAPQSDEKVRDGRARGLVTDGDLTVGEAHADVALDQWDVLITDRGQGVGTFLRESDSTNWIRLTPGQAFAMQSSTQIRIGNREFVYHAINRR